MPIGFQQLLICWPCSDGMEVDPSATTGSVSPAHHLRPVSRQSRTWKNRSVLLASRSGVRGVRRVQWSMVQRSNTMVKLFTQNL